MNDLMVGVTMSEILWMNLCRENAIRLEEKEKKEKEMLNQIIEEAEDYKIEFYRKRMVAVDNNKASNREKEKVSGSNVKKKKIANIVI